MAVRRRRKRAAASAADDCFTCSRRSAKCDRRRPYCSQCLEISNECSGYKTQLTWGVGVASRGKFRGLSLPIAEAPPVPCQPKKAAVKRSRPSLAALSTSISVPPADAALYRDPDSALDTASTNGPTPSATALDALCGPSCGPLLMPRIALPTTPQLPLDDAVFYRHLGHPSGTGFNCCGLPLAFVADNLPAPTSLVGENCNPFFSLDQPFFGDKSSSPADSFLLAPHDACVPPPYPPATTFFLDSRLAPSSRLSFAYSPAGASTQA